MATQKLTPRQFAVQKGITLQGVYQRVWEGRLPAEKVDGRWYIVISDPPEEKAGKLNN
jgi:hypothetical protein